MKVMLHDIAGYLTEHAAWQWLETCTRPDVLPRLAGLSPDQVEVRHSDFVLPAQAQQQPRSAAFLAPECAADAKLSHSAAACMWTLGALTFYALMGVDVLEGRGGATQTADTPVPRLGSTHASAELASLLHQCLHYDPAQRPDAEHVHRLAEAALKHRPQPAARISAPAGRSLATSLRELWPESMQPLLCLLLLCCLGGRLHAQQSQPTAEMQQLVQRCQALRQHQAKAKVTQQFNLDTKWTLMDEIAIDRKGECTVNDPVSTFGFNDMGFRIAKYHGGVTNMGGRFRNGQDRRYHYSLIEVTAKRGATIGYDITGREGAQQFAIVPYDATAPYDATLTLQGSPCAKAMVKQGVCYLTMTHPVKPTDVLHLTIHNKGAQHKAFIIVNYNPWK